LSHCWGALKKGEVPPYCTTRKNINKREEGLKSTDLPLTFRHAIEVVRGLNLKYLWIDSLCIKQGKGGDWEKESKKMEDVYASAYCTIAATSADDSNAGFLTPRHIGDYVYTHDDLGRQVYVGTDIADFDNEIEKARLNNRTWVMQERFLSRRTIHFGTNQMYWECGEGVYCEDLTQIKK
jgi:Heterokaryon incompatibility protein (HET)